jgi:hypothetical protein
MEYIAIAAVAPKGMQDHGYNVTCAKCGVLLRASFDPGTKKYFGDKPDHPTFCGPCYRERSKNK